MIYRMLQGLAILAVGVYASVLLTLMGALSLITLSSFGAVSAPF